MATVGRKNLKEQAKEPVPVEEKDKNETTEVEEDDIVEESENIESEKNDIVEESEVVEKEEVELAGAEKRKTKKALKAIIHILYNGRMYEPQEELPVDNAEMVEAWLDAGTAIWD